MGASETNKMKSGQNQNVCHNLQEGKFHIQEAIDLYREWGAYAKVTALEEKYSSILSRDGEGVREVVDPPPQTIEFATTS